MNSKKIILFWIATIFTLFNSHILVAHANGTVVNSLDYAPYYFDQYYNYIADGMEFDDYEVEVYFPPNEEGIYQFNVDNHAMNKIQVYQVGSDGVYELAYFVGDDPQQDFRYHADSTDELKSLVLPNTLEMGQVFYQGYAGDQAVTVIDILESYEHNGTVYQDVVILESLRDGNNRTHTYLAPQVGVLLVNRISGDGAFDITAGLVERKQSLPTENSDHQTSPPTTNSSEREEMIELLASGGIIDKYSYTEAEAELARLEALTLEVGSVFKGDFVSPDYANQMNSGNISRGASLMLGEYLYHYFELHGDAVVLDERYQFQVDFEDIPRAGTWTNQIGSYIVFLGSGIGMGDNVSNIYIEILGTDTIQRTAQIETTDTREIDLVSNFSDGNRNVKVNTLVRPGELGGTGWYSEPQHHAYFFYNQAGGVSLAYPEGPGYVEYRMVED